MGRLEDESDRLRYSAYHLKQALQLAEASQACDRVATVRRLRSEMLAKIALAAKSLGIQIAPSEEPSA